MIAPQRPKRILCVWVVCACSCSGSCGCCCSSSSCWCCCEIEKIIQQKESKKGNKDTHTHTHTHTYMLLRDYMNQPELPPLWNNVGCVVCTVFLVKAALEAAIWIRMHVGKREEARILVHLVVAWSCVVVWPLYERTDWSWRLNAVVPAALATRMVYKVRTTNKMHEETWRNMCSRHFPAYVCCVFCSILAMLF